MAEATWRKEMRGGVEYEEQQLENSWPPDAGAWHEYEFSLIHSFIHHHCPLHPLRPFPNPLLMPGS